MNKTPNTALKALSLVAGTGLRYAAASPLARR